MALISQDGHSRKDYKLRFDVTNYSNDPIKAPLSVFQRVVSYVDDSRPVNIDSNRLMPVFRGLRAKDFQYYFYILGLMEKNSRPVHAEHRAMRDFFGDKYVQTVAQAIDRLVKAGLLIRQENKRGWYFVNPVYAWKGNRLDYLDLSSFEDRTGL